MRWLPYALTGRTAERLLEQGASALAAGEFQAARRCAQELLARSPHDARALLLAGRIERSGIDLRAALDYFERAALARPDWHVPYVELAGIYGWSGDEATAAAIVDLAARTVPATSESMAELARACAQFDAQRACTLYERALQLEPGLREAEYGLVAALLRTGDRQAARRHAEAAAAHSDRHSFNLRAMVAEAESDLETAQAILEEGAARYPQEPSFLYNLHALKARRGHRRDAERELDRLLEGWPQDPHASVAKAALLLERGEFRQGFAALEARLRLPEVPAVRHAPVPRWDGGALAGKQLLVIDERGLADSILFLRFLPRLIARGAKLRYVCQKPLYALYAGQPELVPVDVQPEGSARAGTQGCELFVTLPSVPHLLAVEDPASPPYLAPPPHLVEHWAGKLPDDGLLVGLQCTSDTSLAGERSIPLSEIGPLLETDGTRFVTMDAAVAQAAGSRCTDLSAEIQDLADACAVLANLDLFVTVDHSLAHVGGAIGAPVCLMAPADIDWRWSGPSAATCYWYGSVRVFRQRAADKWEDVVAEVAAGVKKNAAQGRRSRSDQDA